MPLTLRGSTVRTVSVRGRSGRNDPTGCDPGVRDGSLWVLPSISAVLALIVGWVVSQINVSPGFAAGFSGHRG